MKRILFLIVSFALVMALAVVPVSAAKQTSKTPPSEIDPDDFVRYVDNEFFPLQPGTTFFYEGEDEGVPISDEMFVTHRTKVILGVTTIVVRDRAFEDGVLVEETFDWFAQDRAGNVWYFGEDSRELDPDGNVISTEGSWEAGVDEAQPGIIMLADPHVGDRYRQELAPGVAEDMAMVLSLDKSQCVPYGCFDDLLLTKEWSPLDPGVVEHKYYAEGVGFILSVMVKGGDERLELVQITAEDEDD